MEIPGLQYFPGYLGATAQAELLAAIDRQPWLNDLKRRVQHYGYRYDYKNRSVDHRMFLGTLPGWINPLVQKLKCDKLISDEPDQAIINEYQAGQGIASHIDCIPCFGPAIISLSLGGTCVMDFSHSRTGQQVALLLEPGSLLVLKKEARYDWKHGIASRKTDNYRGTSLERQRRVSITLRKVLINADR